MITCPNCSKELRDDAKFCDSCGTKMTQSGLCPNCGVQTRPEFAFCQSCGAPLTEAPAEDAPAAVISKKKKFPWKAILFSIVGIVLIAAIAIAAFLFFGGRKNHTDYALYVKDSEIFFSNLKKNSEPWQVTSRFYESLDNEAWASPLTSGNFSWMFYMNENSKLIFFPDNLTTDSRLYYKDVSKPNSDKVKIDSDIQKYVVNDSATTVTYLKDEDGTLYQYNITKDSMEKIAGDVDDFYVSDDGRKIIYRNTEDNVYLQYVGKDKEKIASEISSIDYVSEDLSTVYYTKEDALYKQAEGRDKEKIASDVYSVIRIYDSGEIYYLTAETEEFKLMDYVIDDMKDADAAAVEPVWADFINYPNRSDYATYEAYSDAWDAEYDRAYEAYSDALKEYRTAKTRDELRAELRTETFYWNNYSLHYYNGKEDTVITDSFDFDYLTFVYATDAPVISYLAYNQPILPSVKLSEVESIYDVEDMIESALAPSSERYIAIKDAATVIEQEKEARYFNFNDSGTSVYYIDNVPDEKSYGDLYHISISGGKVGKPELYDTEVKLSSGSFISDNEFRYFKNMNNGAGDLYINKKYVDSDVFYSNLYLYSHLNPVVYFTDWDEDTHSGTLNIYDGKNSVTIADDVFNLSGTPDGKILYLYDYSLKSYKGELYQWSNGRSTKIDDDVAAIIPFYAGADKYRHCY